MLKTVLLASAMMISAPVLAQDMGTQEQALPGQETTAPEADATTQTMPDPALPETQQPLDSSEAQTTAPQTTDTPAGTPPADTPDVTDAEEPQRAGPDQIAQIVEAEFPTYDKSGTGEVNREEFAEWMVALRSATEPGINAQSAEVQGWIGQAFAQADADNSGGVSKQELTAFLSQGA